MPMQKLNSSVLKCLEPSCHKVPSISLDVQKIVRGSVLYTAAQGLTCEDDVAGITIYLETKFPGLHIEPTKNPGWLLREQRKLREGEAQVKDENAPATADEISALQAKYGDGKARKK